VPRGWHSRFAPRQGLGLGRGDGSARGAVRDLHFGNAAFRSPPPDLAALLYDPVPRRQPWPFEPAYLEVLCNGSGLVREMAAIRRVQGRAVCEPDEADRLSALFCGWLALAFWSMLPDWHADPAQRARLARYVSARSPATSRTPSPRQN
jgi:hypothetical protein